MSKLYDDFPAFFVHGFGHSGKAWNEFIPVNSQLSWSGLALLVDIGMAANN